MTDPVRVFVDPNICVGPAGAWTAVLRFDVPGPFRVGDEVVAVVDGLESRATVAALTSSLIYLDMDWASDGASDPLHLAYPHLIVSNMGSELPHYANAWTSQRGRCFRLVTHDPGVDGRHGDGQPDHCGRAVTVSGVFVDPRGRRHRVESCEGHAHGLEGVESVG